jgi:cell shape-determining protein MreC
MKGFNSWIAVKLTDILSSMWLFWMLVILLIIAAIMEPPNTPYTFVMFVISAAFQAVALPVLAVTSNLQGARQERVARDTYKNTLEELKLINEEIKVVKENLKILRELQEES